MQQTISIIISCFNEQENIPELYERLNKLFQKIKYTGEFIFIDNRSTDSSLQVLKKLAKKDKRIKVLAMSRNFGSPQPSFAAGLQYAKGDAAVFLHGDMQDPPEFITEFIKKWKQGYEVVYGIHSKRQGVSLFWNFYYRSFYYIFNKLSYVFMPIDAGDFSLIDRVVINELNTMNEYDYYLRGLRSYVGFNQIGIEYVRKPRTHGTSSESFWKGLFWAKTLIINFSLKPLAFISQLAFLVMLLTVILIIVNLYMVVAYHNSPRGIPTIVLLILFLGAVQMLSLSVIAEYLAKIFLEIKRRPRYIIKEAINLKKK